MSSAGSSVMNYFTHPQFLSRAAALATPVLAGYYAVPIAMKISCLWMGDLQVWGHDPDRVAQANLVARVVGIVGAAFGAIQIVFAFQSSPFVRRIAWLTSYLLFLAGLKMREYLGN